MESSEVSLGKEAAGEEVGDEIVEEIGLEDEQPG